MVSGIFLVFHRCPMVSPLWSHRLSRSTHGINIHICIYMYIHMYEPIHTHKSQFLGICMWVQVTTPPPPSTTFVHTKDTYIHTLLYVSSANIGVYKYAVASGCGCICMFAISRHQCPTVISITSPSLHHPSPTIQAPKLPAPG